MCELVHISKGNQKTGAIPSFSVSSGVTCAPSACATCYQRGCYARKLELLRPSVRKAWWENYELALSDPGFLEAWLNHYFSSLSAPRLFRIHVGGDFFSDAYFALWLRVIRAHPHTRFLAFTKQTDVIRPYLDDLPENFSLVLSAWPGVPLDEELRLRLPVAWMDDGTETRIPENAVSCPGHCEECAFCWAMNGKDVVFKKH